MEMYRLQTVITTLLLFIVTQVSCTAKFSLDLLQFHNTKGLLDDRSCCVGPEVDNVCSGTCNTYFTVCLKPYQVDVTAGDCAFGEYVTDVMGRGNNSFAFPRHQGSFTNPLVFDIDYTWLGDFSLVVDSYHEATDSTAQLIVKANASRRHVTPEQGYTTMQLVSSNVEHPHILDLQYKIDCDAEYYGPDCNKHCSPRDDDLGHYECDDLGNKTCRQGWQGPYCDKAICLEGCSAEHGECSRPNECSCRVGWQGRFCDQCLPYPNCGHGYCEVAWECKCYDGWGGLYCNQDLNFCTNNKPCQNGGTCTNTGEGSYTCTCPSGFSGANCETEIDNCQLQPCQNGGECKDIGNDYICDCPEGYYGSRCETYSTRCEEFPCANGATCEPVGSSFRCRCAEGWTGVNCEQPVNECALVDEPCRNGGTCVDGDGTYTCQCLQGFSGDFCETNDDECGGQNPCLNNGECVDGENRFHCRCRPGYMGDLCETDIDDCLTRPCANGGSCKDKVNDFQCFCTPGYTGRFCSEPVNNCSPNQCMNGGRCSHLENSFDCICPTGYAGPLCQYRAGEVPSAQPGVSQMPSDSTSTATTSRVMGQPAGVQTDETKQKPTGDVELTQPQLILIVCLASGIPMCLLFILVTILLCRRCRRQAANDRSLEAEQNEVNGLNNRIHNVVATEKCKEPYEYPTTEKKVPNDFEQTASAHQLPLHYKNSAAAAQPTKVVHKDMIKDINRANERQLLNNTNSSVLSSAPDQQYIPYYHPERLANIPNTLLTQQQPCWTSTHSTNNSNNVDSSAISTVCGSVSQTTGSTSPQMYDATNSNSCDSKSQKSLQPSVRHSHHERRALPPSRHQHRRSLCQVTDTTDESYHGTCDV